MNNEEFNEYLNKCNYNKKYKLIDDGDMYPQSMPQVRWYKFQEDVKGYNKEIIYMLKIQPMKMKEYFNLFAIKFSMTINRNLKEYYQNNTKQVLFKNDYITMDLQIISHDEYINNKKCNLYITINERIKHMMDNYPKHYFLYCIYMGIINLDALYNENNNQGMFNYITTNEIIKPKSINEELQMYIINFVTEKQKIYDEKQNQMINEIQKQIDDQTLPESLIIPNSKNVKPITNSEMDDTQDPCDINDLIAIYNLKTPNYNPNEKIMTEDEKNIYKELVNNFIPNLIAKTYNTEPDYDPRIRFYYSNKKPNMLDYVNSMINVKYDMTINQIIKTVLNTIYNVKHTPYTIANVLCQQLPMANEIYSYDDIRYANFKIDEYDNNITNDVKEIINQNNDYIYNVDLNKQLAYDIHIPIVNIDYYTNKTLAITIYPFADENVIPVIESIIDSHKQNSYDWNVDLARRLTTYIKT